MTRKKKRSQPHQGPAVISSLSIWNHPSRFWRATGGIAKEREGG